MVRPTRSTRWGILTFTSIVLPLLCIACSSTATLHLTYNYGSFSCPSNATVQPNHEFATLSLHPGYRLVVKWQPFPGPTSAETMPSPVSLSAELVGPFPSFDAAQQVRQPDGSIGAGSIVASTSPLHTDDWTNKTYVSNMKLSPSLIPGYYVAVEQVDSGVNNDTSHATGTCILNITP